MSDKKPGDVPKKKGGAKKLLMMAGALIVLVGGGAGAGVYAARSGLVGGAHAAEPVDDRPKLVPKSEQKPTADAEGEGGGHGSAEGEAAPKVVGMETPDGHGGDRYASNYYTLEKDFTANLQDSIHIVQVGIAVSTPYDEKVIEHLKSNDIAVRSAVLMALGDTPEEQVITSQGKRQLQARLVAAINDVLKQKEGFGGVGNVYFTNFVVQ